MRRLPARVPSAWRSVRCVHEALSQDVEDGGSRGRGDPSRSRNRSRASPKLATATGQETRGIEVDYDVFENLRPPNPPPTADNYGKPYEVADLNFKLKAGSKAVDAG
jgi:hypothetical protein